MHSPKRPPLTWPWRTEDSPARAQTADLSAAGPWLLLQQGRRPGVRLPGLSRGSEPLPFTPGPAWRGATPLLRPVCVDTSSWRRTFIWSLSGPFQFPGNGWMAWCCSRLRSPSHTPALPPEHAEGQQRGTATTACVTWAVFLSCSLVPGLGHLTGTEAHWAHASAPGQPQSLAQPLGRLPAACDMARVSQGQRASALTHPVLTKPLVFTTPPQTSHLAKATSQGHWQVLLRAEFPTRGLPGDTFRMAATWGWSRRPPGSGAGV